MSEPRYCFECGGDGQLLPCAWDPAFVVCNRCQRPYSVDLLDELEKRQKELGTFGDLAGAYWDEVNRDTSGGGGGDDGHRYVPDRPIGDETLIGVITESYRKDGTNIQCSTIYASTEEAREAMADWVENPPDDQELAELKAESQAARTEVRETRKRLRSRLEEFRAAKSQEGGD